MQLFCVAPGVATIKNTEGDLRKAKVDILKLSNLNDEKGLEGSEEFKVVIHEILDLTELEKELNRMLKNNQSVALKLKDQYIRVVTASAIIYHHQSFNLLSGNLDATIKWYNNNFLEFKNKSGKIVKINLGDGVIVAYQFSRLCWNKKGEILTIVRDRLGYNECPFGSLHFHPDYFIKDN